MTYEEVSEEVWGMSHFLNLDEFMDRMVLLLMSYGGVEDSGTRKEE